MSDRKFDFFYFCVFERYYFSAGAFPSSVVLSMKKDRPELLEKFLKEHDYTEKQLHEDDMHEAYFEGSEDIMV